LRVKKLDHVAIVVENVNKALERYEKIFGLKGEIIVRDDMGIKFGILNFPNFRIELMEPIKEDSVIYNFLKKRGEGVHHIALEVENIEEAIRDIKNGGGELVDENPKEGLHGYKMVFIHPKSLNRVLVELIEW